ncbi:unnamed protein product [Arctogadus glacialis]
MVSEYNNWHSRIKVHIEMLQSPNQLITIPTNSSPYQPTNSSTRQTNQLFNQANQPTLQPDKPTNSSTRQTNQLFNQTNQPTLQPEKPTNSSTRQTNQLFNQTKLFTIPGV